MKRALLLAVLLASLAAACGRHVVLDPEQVRSLDNKAWTILSEPDAAAPPQSPPPAQP